MSLLILLNPKQRGGVIDAGPEIWINLLEKWDKQKKEAKHREELEDLDDTNVVERVIAPAPVKETRTLELQAGIASFSLLSQQLEAIRAQIELLALAKLQEQAVIEAQVKEFERQLQLQVEIDIKRAELARKILEMQDEEEAFWYLITNS